MSLFARHSRLSPIVRPGLFAVVVRGNTRQGVGGIVRYASNSTTPRANRLSSRTVAGVGLLSAGAVLTLGLGTIYADSSATVDGAATFATTQTIGSLVRSYVVFGMCSVPALVDLSPSILSFLTSIPGIKQITETFVRVTFFEQFVGGDTAQGTIPLLRQLRAANKGALFAYSVEVDEDEAAGSSKKSKKDGDIKPKHKEIVDEMIRCIDVAADFEDSVLGGRATIKGRKTWVAVKMTALLPDAQSLINLSSHIIANRPEPPIPVPFPGYPVPSDLDVLYKKSSTETRHSAEAVMPPDTTTHALSDKDIESLRELHADLIRICQRAQERGVRVIIDAEYSWYQPAIDALQLSLMRQFNKLPEGSSDSNSSLVLPLVYGTYQAYLRRTPAHLKLTMLDAKKHNYSLGVKLVRGAYHPHEITAHTTRQAISEQSHSEGTVTKTHHGQSLSISPDPYPPVWTTKDDTDNCYNECLKELISAIKEDLETSSSPSRSSLPASADTSPISWATPSSWMTKITGRNTSNTTPTNVSNSQSSGQKFPTIGVLFGTHNWKSCNLILDELVRNGLAMREVVLPGNDTSIVHLEEEVTERVTMGQLYGMSNALTDYLVARTRSNSPLVIKYVPYGALSEVMPYLSRRAIENKSVLGDGGAIDERRRAGSELWRRLFG